MNPEVATHFEFSLANDDSWGILVGTMSSRVSLSNEAVRTEPDRSHHVQNKAVVSALLLFAFATLYIGRVIHTRQALLFVLGGVARIVLYHASFGFTASWRVFISDRQGAGLRAQMLMLALASALFVPVLASGTFLGQTLRASLAPVGLAVVAGAFMFGAGMQLGGGCASGTLYAAGGGSTRMAVTLAAFIAGSVIGSAHAPWWSGVPSWRTLSLLDQFGPVAALVLSLAAFGSITWFTVIFERRRHGRLISQTSSSSDHRLLKGPWPMVWGAIGLAIVNFLALVLSGRPWGITSALALWGAKVLAVMGVDVASWPYWSDPARASQLESTILNDVTSVMNFGIMIGAFLAAGLAGRLRGRLHIPAKSVLAAIVGGLLMGYGARIGFGCNIGAYFSGIVSMSLHGWLWLVSGLVGSVVGTHMRPWFDLPVERTVR